MRHKLIVIAVLICFCFLRIESQNINIHSVMSARGNNSNIGYTLDGSWMSQGSRLKLLNSANFGSSGTYSKSVQIVDSYVSSGSLTQATNLPYNNIFFFGSFDKNDPNLGVFTSGEIDSLYNWSLRGGKMIICSGQHTAPQTMPYDSRVLDLKWGIFWLNATPSYFIPTPAGDSTDIFNGPFGKCSGAYQGGTLQGYFDPINPNSKVLATNPNGKPTLIMDCKTLDLITADVDGYTLLGNVTSTPSVLNDQDIFWVNTLVFMDKLQPLPLLTYSNNNLQLNSTYVAYQWYRNGQPLPGQSSAVYTPTQTGNYFVEVTFNGGCKQKSDTLKVEGSLGIVEQNAGLKFAQIIPNPFNTDAILYFEKDVNNITVSITDELGKTVRSQKFSGRELKIERKDLAAGVYIITLSDSGKVRDQIKIVIN